MKKVSFFMIVFVLSGTLMAEKVATIKDVLKPTFLAIDDTQVYIADQSSVRIYSFKDFKFKKKFGKQGEGPQEFLTVSGEGIAINPQKDQLVVNSTGKVSFWTKDGQYIKELKTRGMQVMGLYQPIGKGFAGYDIILGENQSVDMTLNIFDHQLKKVKELQRQKFFSQSSLDFPMLMAIFQTHDNKIFASGQEGFVINIFNEKGDKVGAITQEYKQLKLTDSYKERVINFMKTSPFTKDRYELIKNMIKFRPYFPVIQNFVVADNKVYVTTYLEKGDASEIFVFDTSGKFLKKVFLKVKLVDAIRPYPSAFKNDKLYQIFDNDENETWEIHATPVK